MICAKCGKESNDDFYKSDRKCKPCRREMVRANRSLKADYYREYDKNRFQNDPKVKERHREYQKTDAGKAASKRASKKYVELNQIKRAVHIMTGNAIRDGRITKGPCEKCSSNIVHAHHDDYAYPMNVRWLCAVHHSQWHKLNGEGLNG